MTVTVLRACPYSKAKVYRSPNRILLESYGATVVKAERIISTNMFDIQCLDSGREVLDRHIGSFLNEYFPSITLEELKKAEKVNSSIRAILFSPSRID